MYPALERLAASDDRVVPRWWSVKHEALSAIARNLQERSRLSEAEAVYRRVLADDLEDVPLLHIDMLEDLARVLRREGGKDAEADELECEAAEIQAKHNTVQLREQAGPGRVKGL